jgi:hypothetical protein
VLGNTDIRKVYSYPTAGECNVKKFLIHFILVSALAACSNPELKWIDTMTAVDENPGRISGSVGAKEIVFFTFGIDGETDLPIGKQHDISGNIPITIILPAGNSPNALVPAVEYIGKSLDPLSGVTRDFNSPVIYTVTAEDGSTATYGVTVYVKGPGSKDIVHFAIDVSSMSAEGTIDQGKGTITVTVPAGTDLAHLTAHVTHTGDFTLGPLGRPHSDETFTFTGDFSAPTKWTVVAQDDSTKEYTVTVVREKSHDKEITLFNLGIAGEEDIIGGEPQPDGKYPIVAIVPSDGPLADKSPFIKYVGASISPAQETPLDFSAPKTYTVTAEDGSTREYTVTIVQKNSTADDEKIITGFYFNEPLVQGIIDQVSHTIALTVPAGTNLSALRPDIYYKGAFVSPISGRPIDFTEPVKYKVYAQDGQSQEYTVHVFPAPAPPVVDVPGEGSGAKVDVGTDKGTGTDSGNYTVIVEFPTNIENPVINITYPAASTVDNETLNQILNQLILLQNKEVTHITNNTINNYIKNNPSYTQISNDVKVDVTVINPPANPPSQPTPPVSNTASIDAFYFTSPVAVGVIGTTGTGTTANPIPITVSVPYGTDLRNLTAGICYTGKEIAGIPGTSPLKHTTSFASPVSYTVNAQDDKTTKTYKVTVTPTQNNAKEITAFSFKDDGVVMKNVIISAVPNAAKKYPIDVTVSLTNGATLNSLTPVITINGKTLSGKGFSTDANGPGTVTVSTAVNFSNETSVEYKVTAENGETRTYSVTVYEESNDDNPEITGFYFTNPPAVGLVNQNTDTISVTVPSGANIRALTPALYFNGASVQPASGQAKDFSGPVAYTVTGTSGKTRQYTVTVTPTPSNAKDITRFTIPGVPSAETVISAVTDSDGTYPIAVWVPTGLPLNSIAPAITHTGVSISPSPGTPLNFNTSQKYTVTAEDGSTKTYTVSVKTRDDDAKIMTSFIFNEVPVSEGAPVRAVGSINQTAHTVSVKVPYNANVSSLVPTITYIGKSISGPGGSDRTANPFTGTAQNFNTNKTYTVKDQNNGEQTYTVTVTKQSPFTVSFTGEIETSVIASNTFDQNSGVVTVTVDTGNVSAPYEWYVNGVKQPAPNTQTTFSLNVGDGSFTPGRHEIMVSGKKNGLHYTTKVYFDVSR